MGTAGYSCFRALFHGEALLFYPFETRKEEKKMKTTFVKRIALVLALVTMLVLSSCDFLGYEDPKEIWENAVIREDCELGKGAKTIEVELVVEENKITFTIHTDADTLGDALLEHGIINGEEGAYGLYVKMVNGIIADYDVDGSYWGFYQNGEYLMTGVDTTSIVGGEHFEIVYSK